MKTIKDLLISAFEKLKKIHVLRSVLADCDGDSNSADSRDGNSRDSSGFFSGGGKNK